MSRALDNAVRGWQLIETYKPVANEGIKDFLLPPDFEKFRLVGHVRLSAAGALIGYARRNGVFLSNNGDLYGASHYKSAGSTSIGSGPAATASIYLAPYAAPSTLVPSFDCEIDPGDSNRTPAFRSEAHGYSGSPIYDVFLGFFHTFVNSVGRLDAIRIQGSGSGAQIQPQTFVALHGLR